MSHSVVKEKKFLMSVVAALLAMALTCISFITAVLMQLPVSAVNKKMASSGYFEDQAQCLEDRVMSLTEQVGLPVEIVEGIFTSEEILNITKEHTLNLIRGYEDELNLAAVSERLRERLYSYLEEENISKSCIDTRVFKDYLSQAEIIYRETVDHAFILNIYSVSKTVSAYCLGGLGVLLLFAVLCIVFIYKMTKTRSKTLSYVIRALTAAVLLTGIPGGLAIGLNWYERISIHPAFVLNFAKSYINGTFETVMLMCLVWIAVIIICSLSVNVISNKRQR